MQANCFARFFDEVDRRAVGFEDFRANGLLLPATSSAALKTGLPLHRGPHRHYNELVAERVGQIEASWSRSCAKDGWQAKRDALMRLHLLQRGLRRRLMERERRALFLSRKDPFRPGVDFTELDAMADAIWQSISGVPT